MPALKNQRHEKFALALFEGKTATEAYERAGYKPCRKNAARLTTFDDVKARLSELQAQVAKASEVTVLLAELEAARARADSLDQLSSVVKAISEKAKISGLLVQRVEVGGPGGFDEAETYSDLADRMLSGLEAMYRPVSEGDREGLAGLLERQGDELGEYLAAIHARPVNG